MATRTKVIAVVICIMVAINVVTATTEYVFEFGSKHRGKQIVDKEGSIGLLSLNNEINIPIPRNTKVSYVKVIVWALSSPKVDFDEQTSTVSINYSWTQVPYSSYRIFAKGVPDEDSSSDEE